MSPPFNLDGFERQSPERKGIKSSQILDFLKEAEDLGISFNGFMLYRHGAVVSEHWWSPYRPDLRHMMHSATKSFLSAAVGFAVSEGFFSLNDKVISLFPEHAPSDPEPNLAAMTVEDLLTQTSGHVIGTSGGTWRGIKSSWIEQFFKIAVVHEPGTYFKYTSATSFMLSAIIHRTTGQSTHSFLMPRLFQPLRISGLQWDVGPEGINPGGNGISCRTSDLLKLAVLHLNKGAWEGRQLLPEEWVKAATTSQRGNPYGYQWWIGPGKSYYAYGLFGQFAFVFPEHDAVVVTTSSVPPGEQELRALVWRHFPAMFSSENPPVDSSSNSLSSFLKTSLHTPRPWPDQSVVEAIDISDRLFVVKPNSDNLEAFSFAFSGDKCTFYAWDHRGLHLVEVGLDRWVESETTISGAHLHHGYEPPILRVVAKGVWSSRTSFTMVWTFVETAFQDHVTVRMIKENEAVLERGVNVNSFGTQRPPIAAYIMGNGSGASAGLQIIDRVREVSDKVASLPEPRRTVPYSCGSVSFGELLDDPEAKAVLEKAMPGLFSHPDLARARPYNLYTLANNVPRLTSDVLRHLDTQLGKIPLT